MYKKQVKNSPIQSTSNCLDGTPLSASNSRLTSTDRCQVLSYH